jgi:hypothetical protein
LWVGRFDKLSANGFVGWRFDKLSVNGFVSWRLDKLSVNGFVGWALRQAQRERLCGLGASASSA